MSKKGVIPAKIVAQYFISKSSESGKPITNKKLQKLLYYSQGWSLVFRDKKLFNEDIEAWVHGPAVRSVYVEYKRFGFNPIHDIVIEQEKIKKFPSDIKKLLDEIWRVYGKFDAEYLEALTHSEKPWQEARQGLESHENSDNTISLATMKDYYKEKKEKSRVK